MRYRLKSKATKRFKETPPKLIDSLAMCMSMKSRVNRHFPDVEIWIEDEFGKRIVESEK